MNFNQSLIRDLTLLCLIILSRLLIRVSVDKVLGKFQHRFKSERAKAKTLTFRSLIFNLFDTLVFFLLLLIILNALGVNLMPILASAGIFGLAISFGSQALVKDIIAGFFILLEDQFNVGDEVVINGEQGKVQHLTLRLTTLQDKDGSLIYIPNSQITILKKITSS